MSVAVGMSSPILGCMYVESLSTIVVLVILVLVVAVWLPNRTAKSMRHVEEHREDRFSPSLHLIDADSGTRFSDAHTPRTKGVAMQPMDQAVQGATPQHIARVRELRRAAVRRRQIIVAVLAVVTIVVLGLAFGLKFSPLFALIPAALLAGVLALGARAAAQARQWERKVADQAARTGKDSKTSKAAKAASADTAAAVNAARQEFVPMSVDGAPAATSIADDPTEAMEKREIRRVLRDAALEQQRRREERASAAAASAAQAASAVEAAMPAESVSRPESESVESAVSVELSDATNELTEISPAPALEAFDMAASQDLISFSLGAPRDGETPKTAEPESLEIKSTRQVAKAEPVDEAKRAQLAEEAVSAFADAAAFHDAEEQAEVEPPAATSDSLGAGLDAILTRRNA